MAFHRDSFARAVKTLAEQGVFIGTSSWKYPGWCGMIYDEGRYAYRGKFAKSRFEKDCLRGHCFRPSTINSPTLNHSVRRRCAKELVKVPDLSDIWPSHE